MPLSLSLSLPSVFVLLNILSKWHGAEGKSEIKFQLNEMRPLQTIQFIGNTRGIKIIETHWLLFVHPVLESIFGHSFRYWLREREWVSKTVSFMRWPIPNQISNNWISRKSINFSAQLNHSIGSIFFFFSRTNSWISAIIPFFRLNLQRAHLSIPHSVLLPFELARQNWTICLKRSKVNNKINEMP